jgi:lactate dehydrogenase-like 2-hydroxyacid dehydrogenase
VQVVGRAGVGIDNVDLQAATEVGCLVVNAPTANTVAAAEHGIALLTALARNVAQASASMKAGMFLGKFQFFKAYSCEFFFLLSRLSWLYMGGLIALRPNYSQLLNCGPLKNTE